MLAFPPIEELIPHRGTMLLLDQVSTEDEESITVRAIVSRDAWYADEHGRMPAWIGLELMAQAAAAYAGVRAQGLPPRRGMLIGCKAYRAAVPSFPGGEVLHVNARRTLADASGLSIFDCTIITFTGTPLAAGTIQVFVQGDAT